MNQQPSVYRPTLIGNFSWLFMCIARALRACTALIVIAFAISSPAHAGLLSGSAPTDLGVRQVEGQGQLKPPSPTRNSVSSQADLHPGHPQREYARIAPLKYTGNGKDAMKKLAALLLKMERTVLTQQAPDYIRAECSTRWLGFTDDMEFWLDEKAGVIQVRSASRMGREDFGVNRERIEAIRMQFGA